MQEEKSVKTELSVKPHTSRSAKTSKPKKSIFINKRAVVCEDIVLEGEIRIGEGTVLHPQCKILAEQGPIVIGQNNIIEEKVTIVNRQQKPLLIGDENVFEVGSYIEGTKIGNKNIIEAKARIMGTTSLGNNCVIGAVCSTRNDENIPDNTVIYGDYHNRRTQTNGSNASVHTRHLDYLREVLPKCNYIKVSEKPKGEGSERGDKEGDGERDRERERERDQERKEKPKDRGSAREPSSGHREARSVKKIHS